MAIRSGRSSLSHRSRRYEGRKAVLWEPQSEVDACGVGFVVDSRGRKSHRIISQGLEILVNLTHRGAAGADETTGDGAGILMQMPDRFLRHTAQDHNINLPPEGEYAVGAFFFSKDEAVRTQAEHIIQEAVEARGHQVLGWRDVPVDSSALGYLARKKEPVTKHLFIKRGSHVADRDSFELDLYVTRKRMQKALIEAGMSVPNDAYVISFSANTLIYKGLLLAWQVARYYPDLLDNKMESALALVHQRFSTNTFPEWDLAQPFRYMAHNGEINTLAGNVNWMKARESQLESPLFGEDIEDVRSVIRDEGSDSACFDNVLETLVTGGRSLPHAIMMMIPEAWEQDHRMSEAKRGFYEYHATFMEPWDGPALIGFTDGEVIGATLDRNGLRPARYTITKDGLVILASEAGVLDIPDTQIASKGRLKPGRIFLVDLKQQRVIEDDELKEKISKQKPYAKWVSENKITLQSLPAAQEHLQLPLDEVHEKQRAFGYSVEDLKSVIGPMTTLAKEPIASMGVDTPLAVLSERPKLLYDYFMQTFAQVSNPPIDPIREEMVMSLTALIGHEGPLFSETPEHAMMLELKHPILDNRELAQIRESKQDYLHSETLSILWDPQSGSRGFEESLHLLCDQAEQAVKKGYTVLILSDRMVSKDQAPLPALLAVSAVHHHLIRQGLRKHCSLVVESGEPRGVHHFALLIGFGAHAINPYLALATVEELAEKGALDDLSRDQARVQYIKAINKGLLKVMSKIGVSALQSYHGAQTFEAIGLNNELIDLYFTDTPNRLSGAGIDVIAKEALLRHMTAYPERVREEHLSWGGDYQWRAQGEEHQWSPMAIAQLQKAVRNNDQEAYRAFVREADEMSHQKFTIRGLVKLKNDRDPVALDEVESVDAIMKRFKTGAMSFGSISAEAHETLAVAMNRIGGKSNSGEGGEDENRFTPDANGDLRRSAIKQVASGRFGVTSNYLANADEIQIKMAQGAKPGEGGQLPGPKVSVEIAAVRHSTPGVGLISPPPHHDIYSIEDLAQLIFDLKNANPKARISVKLVSKVGVGTIAAGVAKAHADVVLISGHSGGTGASPLSSIYHAGSPWEVGLAETHQVLVDNGLRSRIVVEADGGLKTGRDVIVAALLGAEEFGFATSALITIGCILLRKCHLNTCSVGVATQRPELRELFNGEPEHVETYFRFIAQEVRQYMAELGFKTFNEMIGQVQCLERIPAPESWKSESLDLTGLLTKAPTNKAEDMYCHIKQKHGLEDQLDHQLIEAAQGSLQNQQPTKHVIKIQNRHRSLGTMLSHEVSRRYGSQGLEHGTIDIRCNGTAGQSFGAFLAKGIRFELVGEANDYVGKGLSGGQIVIRPHDDVPFKAEENIIIGNVALYGATSGKAFIRGQAGERFCVRNSGAQAVVEGTGDHGCEYMTGGNVVVLGSVGRNFAAGMSGGIAYVLMERAQFVQLCNQEMVDLETIGDPSEAEEVQSLIAEHFQNTKSAVAKEVLDNWEQSLPRLIKVIPHEYKRALREGTAERERE